MAPIADPLTHAARPSTTTTTTPPHEALPEALADADALGDAELLSARDTENDITFQASPSFCRMKRPWLTRFTLPPPLLFVASAWKKIVQATE